MSTAAAILAVLLAAEFTFLGAAKILALAPMRHLAAEIGYSVQAYRRIGVLEVSGAGGLLIGLAVPAIGGVAGLGLLLLLGGAVATHLRRGDSPRKYTPAVISGLLVAAYLAVHLATQW
jgi:DoxX-like family